MKILKFGGASVKDADAVKNVSAILKRFVNDEIIVVVSAMGKTTNALETVVDAYYHKQKDPAVILQEIKDFHLRIMDNLFADQAHAVYEDINNLFVEIDWVTEEEPARNYDFVYDQIVSVGELVSTKIISAYLNDNNVTNRWLDVRDVMHTDNNYREGNIDWELSGKLINKIIPSMINEKNKIILTQGFIASTSENYTTTLGREGSDYSAAIFAYALNAAEVIIWKDVTGVMNADPKFYKDAQKLDQLSYHDAIELAYYGASVIHPKTIKPLENKNIPLYVKSFLNHEQNGTMIKADSPTKPLIPSFIFKTNQVLISIAAKDFSFIAENNLSGIFALFSSAGVKINLMQNSAISFSVCVDNAEKIHSLIGELIKDYKVLYNTGVELHTIRHYFQSTIDAVTTGKEILLEQRSRQTVQFVMRKISE